MESQDKVPLSDKSVSENEEFVSKMEFSSDTKYSPESKSDEVGSTPDKDKDISSTESSNVIVEPKSEAAEEESKNVSVEKEDPSCLLTESSIMSSNKEADTVKLDDASPKKVLSQAVSTEALTGGEKFKATFHESSLSTSSSEDRASTHIDRLESSENLKKQSSDEGNVVKCTEKASQTNSGTKSEASPRAESLISICMRKTCTAYEDLKVDADSVEKGTHGNGKSISQDKLQTSIRSSVTAGGDSTAIKNSAEDVEATSFKNNNNGTPEATEIASEKNVTNEKSRMPAETAHQEKTTCKNSGVTTKNTSDKNTGDKHSADTPGTVGENVPKEHSNIPAKTKIMHPKSNESVTNQQSVLFKTVVGKTTSNEAAETEAQSGEKEDDGERRAFFYISSSSIPGMGKDWEWPSVSVSSGYQNQSQHQKPPRRMERRRNTSGSGNCLGTQRCHYMILAVGVLGAILGCVTYHLQDYGIGPKVLRPIGASAAFLSFAVCAFSSAYLSYLSYQVQKRSRQNHQPSNASDPVSAMLINNVPQCYNSDPSHYFTTEAASTLQQVCRETQSVDALDRRGAYSWQQAEIKRPFEKPGPSGYDPDSKRLKIDSIASKGASYEMKSMTRTSETDRSKDRNASQASDSSHYTLADQDQRASNDEIENDEKTPLLPKK